MWAYTAKCVTEVKFLYYFFKNNIVNFRKAASSMGSLPQISLSITEEFFIPRSFTLGMEISNSSKLSR